MPGAGISCTLETSAGEATVKAGAALKRRSPPIDEEAEAEKLERKEEREAEEEDEAG